MDYSMIGKIVKAKAYATEIIQQGRHILRQVKATKSQSPKEAVASTESSTESNGQGESSSGDDDDDEPPISLIHFFLRLEANENFKFPNLDALSNSELFLLARLVEAHYLIRNPPPSTSAGLRKIPRRKLLVYYHRFAKTAILLLLGGAILVTLTWTIEARSMESLSAFLTCMSGFLAYIRS